jgi:putative glycosyltransferase
VSAVFTLLIPKSGGIVDLCLSYQILDSMKLSVVATLYRSAPYIDEFFRRATEAARTIVGDSYEIILVNDGSPDDSLQRAVNLSQANEHLVVVDLSRNFGHHPAMRAGLSYSTGEFVFLIDSDLEESPEWMVEFWAKLHNEKIDVVYGVQENRKGNFFERISGNLYYSFFNTIANINHPINITTARLMTRRYVDSLLQFNEREMVFSCLWLITGYDQRSYPVKKLSRGATSYSLTKKCDHLINAVTSFSAAPLKLIFISGVIIFVGAIAYAGYLTLNRIFFSRTVDGWTSIMVSIWFLGGMIVSFLGVLGLYLSKIYTEVKQRPNVIVREVFGKKRSAN